MIPSGYSRSSPLVADVLTLAICAGSACQTGLWHRIGPPEAVRIRARRVGGGVELNPGA